MPNLKIEVPLVIEVPDSLTLRQVDALWLELGAGIIRALDRDEEYDNCHLVSLASSIKYLDDE